MECLFSQSFLSRSKKTQRPDRFLARITGIYYERRAKGQSFMPSFLLRTYFLLPIEGLFEIRNCKLGDLSAVERIEGASFDDPYPPAVFWELYLNPNNLFRVASIQIKEQGEKKLVGYSVTQFEKEEGKYIAHILSLAVDPETRRRGYGSELMKDILDKVKGSERLTNRIRLEVRISNEEAIALYEKFQFKKLKEIPNYYGRDSDALLMELDL
jgi:ribosomal-protein-alanine N-acetyltransferase